MTSSKVPELKFPDVHEQRLLLVFSGQINKISAY